MIRRIRGWAIVLAGLLAAMPAWPADTPAGPAWVVNPAAPGDHLPPAGGSRCSSIALGRRPGALDSRWASLRGSSTISPASTLSGAVSPTCTCMRPATT